MKVFVFLYKYKYIQNIPTYMWYIYTLYLRIISDNILSLSLPDVCNLPTHHFQKQSNNSFPYVVNAVAVVYSAKGLELVTNNSCIKLYKACVWL